MNQKEAQETQPIPTLYQAYSVQFQNEEQLLDPFNNGTEEHLLFKMIMQTMIFLFQTIQHSTSLPETDIVNYKK